MPSMYDFHIQSVGSFPFITDVSSLSLGDHTVTISITGVNGAAATVREVFNIQGTCLCPRKKYSAV